MGIPVRDALIVDRATWAAVIRHLRSTLPDEGCGLLATTGAGERRVARFYPGENLDHSPTRYTMDPRQVLAAIEDIEVHGRELGAIVHSHPRTPPALSPTDLNEAYYADSWIAIVSFAGASPVARVWTLASGSPVEVELHIVDA